jgi:hypothetical protein
MLISYDMGKIVSSYLFLSCLASNFPFCRALVSPEPVSKLLQQHATDIAQLKTKVGDCSVPPYDNDVFFLRFCLNNVDPMESFQNSLSWRTSETGKLICAAAVEAVQQATSTESSWNNEPVFRNAPHSEKISQFVTSSNCITTTSSIGDLVYCIRAGAIADDLLMKMVNKEQLTEFFLYTKEVNAIVADRRSMATDRLLSVITCNDLSGVRLVGGSSDFRKALSQSSTVASTVYPATAGPTLLLNLPTLLSALVQLFTPLFPESVQKRLKFKQGPLKNVNDLMLIASTSQSPARIEFLQQLDDILYKE